MAYKLTAALLLAAPAAAAQELPILARITPAQETILSAEMDGVLTRFSEDEGESVGEGEVIATIRCDREEARLAAAAAAVRAADVRFVSLTRLVELRSATKMEAQVAEAERERARAEELVLKTLVNSCAIRAPFSGVVASHLVEAFQFVRTGQEVITLFDGSKMRATFLAPSSWMNERQAGDLLGLKVMETGAIYEARIIRMGSVVDPVSRTVETEAEILGDISRLAPGMTAEIIPPGS